MDRFIVVSQKEASEKGFPQAERFFETSWILYETDGTQIIRVRGSAVGDPGQPAPEELNQMAQALTDNLTLSQRDSEIVAEALENPREPSEELLKAARDYRDAVLSGKLKIS